MIPNEYIKVTFTIDDSRLCMDYLDILYWLAMMNDDDLDKAYYFLDVGILHGSI